MRASKDDFANWQRLYGPIMKLLGVGGACIGLVLMAAIVIR
jgi:hypothetical protein